MASWAGRLQGAGKDRHAPLSRPAAAPKSLGWGYTPRLSPESQDSLRIPASGSPLNRALEAGRRASGESALTRPGYAETNQCRPRNYAPRVWLL